MKILTLLNNYKNKYQKLPLVVGATLAGLILGISVVLPYAGWLVFLGIALTLMTILKTNQLRQSLWVGYLIWSSKSAVVLSFLFSTFPITTFSISSSWQQIGLIIFSWSVAVMAMGLGGFVLGVGLFYWQRYFKSNTNWLLVVPMIWLLAEVVSSFAYSIVTWGSVSDLQAYFSMGYVGYAVATVPGLMGLAYFGGVYSLGLAGVLIVSLWYLTKDTISTKFALFGIGVIFLIGTLITINTKVEKNESKILTVDTFFPPSLFLAGGEEGDRADVLKEAVNTAQALHPDYIILPEDSRYLDLVYAGGDRRYAYALFRFLNATSTATIVDTALTKTEGKSGRGVLRSLVFSGTKTPIMSEKKYLTPQGEYLPYLTKYLLKTTGHGYTLKAVGVDTGSMGNLDTPFDYQGPLVLFCFESINPISIWSMLKNRRVQPPFVAHPVSQAWFHSTFLLTHQLDTMLRVQSVWNGVPIVSAGNRAVGKTYLPDGRIFINEEVIRGEGWVIRESRW